MNILLPIFFIYLSYINVKFIKIKYNQKDFSFKKFLSKSANEYKLKKYI